MLLAARSADACCASLNNWCVQRSEPQVIMRLSYAALLLAAGTDFVIVRQKECSTDMQLSSPCYCICSEVLGHSRCTTSHAQLADQTHAALAGAGIYHQSMAGQDVAPAWGVERECRIPSDLRHSRTNAVPLPASNCPVFPVIPALKSASCSHPQLQLFAPLSAMLSQQLLAALRPSASYLEHHQYTSALFSS